MKRREIDVAGEAISNEDSYLDKGHPSPEEADAANTRLGEARRRQLTAERELSELVKQARVSSPEVIEQWISGNLRACAETRHGGGGNQVLLEQMIREWHEVRSGTRDFVQAPWPIRLTYLIASMSVFGF